MSPYVTMPLVFEGVPEAEMQGRAEAFLARMRKRRTVRDYSDKPVPREIIEAAVATAGTAPSGANQQPWTFVCISDPDIKKKIREGAEEELGGQRCGGQTGQLLPPGDEGIPPAQHAAHPVTHREVRVA